MTEHREIWIMLLFIAHMWLVTRFTIRHIFKQSDDRRPYHLKWLMLVFFLPFIGYGLYFWLTRRYTARGEH
ncbi:PLDc N-terminal domain-containing protein [Chitinophaga lutea]